MARKYTDGILHELHTVELNMLKVFVSICEKYQIDYFVSFGTAIGAIRHGGFIPWDDDIDIGMMRSEYEKLRLVPKEEWGEKYFIADARDDCAFHRTLFPRMYMHGTDLEKLKYFKYLKPKTVDKYPIYIDIFLFDEVNNNTFLPLRRFYADSIKRLIVCATCERRIYPDDPLSEKCISLIKKCIISFLRLFDHPGKAIYLSYLRHMKRLSNGTLVTCFEVVESREVSACLCQKSDMFPTVTTHFEGIQIRMQKNYDEVLRKLYGDYMQLPPENRRHNELPRILDFGDGRGNVLEEQWT